jgi:hypothetical protein
MGTTLKEIISKINSAQEKAEDSDNPVFSSSLHSLQHQLTKFVVDKSNSEGVEHSFEFHAMGGSKCGVASV